jgi:MmyB-like transcription regulator ligand binding domain
MGPDSRAGELVQTLQKASPEFARLWEGHEVAKRFAEHKVLIHPRLGPIEVDAGMPNSGSVSGRTSFEPRHGRAR